MAAQQEARPQVSDSFGRGIADINQRHNSLLLCGVPREASAQHVRSLLLHPPPSVRLSRAPA